MSKNQEDQDNIEKSCLDFVRNSIKRNDCFGLSNEEYTELRKWLDESRPNPDSSKFPDFIFEDGFIEHFAVTSSFENRKGSKQKEKSNILKRKSQESFLSNLDKIKPDCLLSNSFNQKFEEHSHLYIHKSMKRNWTKHIKNLDGNKLKLNNGIFLVQYSDMVIHTAFSTGKGPADVYYTYRISGDYDMLNWIFNYKEKIKYLIFIDSFSQSIEVIRIDNIPAIISNYPKGIYAPSVGIESHRYIGFKTENRLS